ncbi:MAG: protein kinase, partial [archaeon]|nr:protein kinase [archaeon]
MDLLDTLIPDQQTTSQNNIQNDTQKENINNTLPPEPKPKKIKKNPPYVYYNQKPVHPAKYTDSDNSEDEGLEDYKMNGYHPVHIGEVLLERYVIMQKLGWGHFSTAWLAKDVKFNTYVAIKIQKSAQQYIDAAYDEVEILQELEKHNFDPEWVKSVQEYWKDEPEKLKNGVLRDHSQIVQLLNSFIYHGQNGRHFCMVFEIMGVTLLEIIKRYNYKGIPLPYVRIITKQILIGLDFLHRMCGIIHTDLKPENVLVCLTPSELKEIEETGFMDITKLKNKKGDKKGEDKKKKADKEITANLDKKVFEKDNDDTMTITTESAMDKPNGKKLRKKN